MIEGTAHRTADGIVISVVATVSQYRAERLSRALSELANGDPDLSRLAEIIAQPLAGESRYPARKPHRVISHTRLKCCK
jgi:hypothetical protein